MIYLEEEIVFLLISLKVPTILRSFIFHPIIILRNYPFHFRKNISWVKDFFSPFFIFLLILILKRVERLEDKLGDEGDKE